IDARHDIAGAESDLLCFREEIVRVPVEHHLADHLNRNQFLWNELRGVKNVERQKVGGLLIDDLQTESEFREMATLNCLKQVAAVKVGVCPVDFDSFVPQHGG